MACLNERCTTRFCTPLDLALALEHFTSRTHYSSYALLLKGAKCNMLES